MYSFLFFLIVCRWFWTIVTDWGWYCMTDALLKPFLWVSRFIPVASEWWLIYNCSNKCSPHHNSKTCMPWQRSRLISTWNPCTQPSVYSWWLWYCWRLDWHTCDKCEWNTWYTGPQMWTVQADNLHHHAGLPYKVICIAYYICGSFIILVPSLNLQWKGSWNRSRNLEQPMRTGVRQSLSVV